MSSLLMIYGATGYVGENVARTARLASDRRWADAAKLDHRPEIGPSSSGAPSGSTLSGRDRQRAQ